jgi:hypothetical protein
VKLIIQFSNKKKNKEHHNISKFVNKEAENQNKNIFVNKEHKNQNKSISVSNEKEKLLQNKENENKNKCVNKEKENRNKNVKNKAHENKNKCSNINKENLLQKFESYKSRIMSLGSIDENASFNDRINILNFRLMTLERDHKSLKKSIRDCSKEDWSGWKVEEIDAKKRKVLELIRLEV